MPFTGRPNVTDAERERMGAASKPKRLLYSAIKKMVERDEPVKLGELKKLEVKTPPAPAKKDTAFDKWNLENRKH